MRLVKTVQLVNDRTLKGGECVTFFVESTEKHERRRYGAF